MFTTPSEAVVIIAPQIRAYKEMSSGAMWRICSGTVMGFGIATCHKVGVHQCSDA